VVAGVHTVVGGALWEGGGVNGSMVGGDVSWGELCLDGLHEWLLDGDDWCLVSEQLVDNWCLDEVLSIYLWYNLVVQGCVHLWYNLLLLNLLCVHLWYNLLLVCVNLGNHLLVEGGVNLWYNLLGGVNLWYNLVVEGCVHLWYHLVVVKVQDWEVVGVVLQEVG